MTNPPLALQPILAGIAIGALAVLGIAMIRSRTAAGVRLAAAFCLAGVGAYSVASLPVVGETLAEAPFLGAVIASLVCGTIGFYAVAARASLEDRPAGIVEFWPAFLLILIGLGALQVGGGLGAVLLALYMGVASALLIVVARLAVQGHVGDLVESRRRLRGPVAALTVIVCLAALADIALSTAIRSGLLRGWMTLDREAALASLTVAAASMLLGVRPQLVQASRPPTAADPDDIVHRAIGHLMDVEQAWRAEGLSLPALSTSLNTPEYRVRRVILTRFGARNFPAFVNTYRVQAAKARLASREADETTVAEIAYEVGFSSLTAFNRAFKAVAGEPPTAWRRRMRDGPKS